MINETGLITGWVLAHNFTDVIISEFNDNQTTASVFELEIFESYEEMESRIKELGLTSNEEIS